MKVFLRRGGFAAANRATAHRTQRFVENAWIRYCIDTIQNALLKRGTLVVEKSEGVPVASAARSLLSGPGPNAT